MKKVKCEICWGSGKFGGWTAAGCPPGVRLPVLHDCVKCNGTGYLQKAGGK